MIEVHRPQPGTKRRPRFVAEFEVETTPRQRQVVGKRLRVAAQFYNRCLQEALARFDAMKADPGWNAARKLPKRSRERGTAFQALREHHRFTKFDLHSAGSAARVAWLREHIGAHEAQTIARRAFLAVDAHGVGLRGKPRYKPGRRGLDSIEGQGPTSAVRYDAGHLALRWGDLVFPLVVLPGNPVQMWAAMHVADGALCYARLVRRVIRGRERHFCQLVLRGEPLRRCEAPASVVGCDLGPSTIAMVADDDAALEQFCAELRPLDREIRRLHRHYDRQHRAGSSACFDSKGRHRKGGCSWQRSKRAQRTKARIAEAHRLMAEHRRSLHGNLAHRLLSHGSTIRIERLSYRAFQRSFGRSTRDRAPGMFVSLLRRLAESAGGSVEEFDARRHRLSQVCLCGTVSKKPLSEREHRCECGVVAQRDLFSAFLARHVEREALNVEAAHLEWLSRVDIPGRTTFAKGLNRRVRWQWAIDREASLGADRPDLAAREGEAA